MKKIDLINGYVESIQKKNVVEYINKKKPIFLKNLTGSVASLVAISCFKSIEKTFIFILNNKEQAAYFLNDLEQFIPEKDLLFYPESYRRPYQIQETDNANVLMRAEVLHRLISRKKPSFIVTYSDAIFEKVITKKELNKSTLKLSVGEEIGIDFLNETLFEYGFSYSDFVTEPGQFSIRGGLVDVFSFSNEHPYRIEFFGDEVESIRSFNINSQLSIKEVKRLDIIPNLEKKETGEKRVPFTDYFRDDSSVWVKDLELSKGQLDKLYLKACDKFENLGKTIKQINPEELFINAKILQESLIKFSVSSFGAKHDNAATEIDFNTSFQPSFNKQFDLLTQHLNNQSEQGYKNLIVCGSMKQEERFLNIFENIDSNFNFSTLLLPIHEGFIDHDNKILCYTDHQLFERYHKFKLKSAQQYKKIITLNEITNLEIGDFVTHIDHGIGKFGGLQKIDVQGKKQEAIKIIYKNNDLLYLSIHSLHKISKFNSKEGTVPKIHQLGSPSWAKTKNKTKTKIKTIAYDLIKLYAKRKNVRGFSFSPDNYLQYELEASFIYEDTPDQLKTTQAVKKDMESESPMDRLICGDVGFGKTEIAIRAAFKAVCDNKQVAILVPTTILALQHYKTLRKRLKDFPCAIDYINRFKTAKQQKETLKKLADGKIDIIIGTHRLVGKDVHFLDLGLLIIDEEQKFGVGVKDKLKTLKTNLDTLTLTATPIPRTLQFSLMAARDLSTIKTAPPNRLPVQTQNIGFNEETLRDAIQYEISRGGQVFFIHNRIENIKEVAVMIQRLCPDIKVGIGHGQMDGQKLELLMLDFIEGEFDLLVSTTIIESGLDIPNANTILINDAQNFGLSDLHQMRGRVGRSNKKAFCYLITPPRISMSEEGRKRIQALEQHADLGSGFNIAMRDLEIRGAGDILGAEQSGFISDIGFEMYQKILNEAVQELKETEFKGTYINDESDSFYMEDSQIDTDMEILIPDHYVNSISERLQLYKDLNALQNEIDLHLFEEKITDRFGPIPETVKRLSDSIRLRWIAKELGFEKIILKNQKMIAYFIANPQSIFFESSQFSGVLDYIQKNPKTCKMKERNNKLSMVFQGIRKIHTAICVLKEIQSSLDSTTLSN
ncbi:MAG: transcription-repair coupling factor [Flavobacteriales bacterium]|nr:transcription-repair coupling factor [Flavobacteriales bacterium]|tara:strand:- start:1549 stop:4896 length:3348 start_codon:yes stop_codon:yes gene_type:complete